MWGNNKYYLQYYFAFKYLFKLYGWLFSLQDSEEGTVNRRWARWSKFLFLEGATVFFLPPHMQTGYGPHLTSCSVATRGFSRGVNGWDMKPNSHSHLEPNMRMSRAIHLPPYMSSWHVHEWIHFYLTALK